MVNLSVCKRSESGTLNAIGNDNQIREEVIAAAKTSKTTLRGVLDGLDSRGEDSSLRFIDSIECQVSVWLRNRGSGFLLPPRVAQCFEVRERRNTMDIELCVRSFE